MFAGNGQKSSENFDFTKVSRFLTARMRCEPEQSKMKSKMKSHGVNECLEIGRATRREGNGEAASNSFDARATIAHSGGQ